VKRSDQFNQTALLAGVVGQVGCLTVLIIGLAFGAGVLLDRFLETGRIFTLIALVGSVPVSLFAITRVSLSALARLQGSEEENTSSTEEDNEK